MPNWTTETECVAFEGVRLIGRGALRVVAAKAQAALTSGTTQPVLVFDDLTGEVIDLDPRNDLPPNPAAPETGIVARGPGRPKLGVVAREVTLLPRHWEWLNAQPGGASVALRKLVEEARKTNQEKDRVRVAREAAYRFLSAMAGNEAGFEEAARALFADRAERFGEIIGGWPEDVREHAARLAARAFGGGGTE